MAQTESRKPQTAEERTEETRFFVRRVRTAARRRFTPEEKVRIVLEGFRREVTVNDLCRREGIKPHSSYAWTKESWRHARNGSLATRCATPPSRRSIHSSGRTESSSSWSAYCSLRSIVSKKRPAQCLRSSRAPAALTDEWRREGGGVDQGSLVSSAQA